ncbi:TetR/AcrR family transcriptional regulator [Mycolicibacterium sp. S2-37]|uniref:TetR/AcrR family transcriptional regulator n=1 Tax=Mycolicibacterium sp. S2-37 TaxID=2810297 RepID=UPI001A9438ED|nr:TetR/AcrR family transcriptional regulator [Mycolicibacterium sp. S2-37]MBO0678683.1 TetR/AcrR family transcriptional regulator [Mycolicibacterium sp. S2-37]
MRSRTDRRAPQRSDDRRDAILDALHQCLRESSFDAVNIADISRRAGVTRSAFYFYFENKAVALAALMERVLDDAFFVNDIFTLTEGPPELRIRAMIEGIVATWETHRYLFSALLGARAVSTTVQEVWDGARDAFVESVAAMITAERAAGTAPVGVDASVLASVLMEFNDRLLERLTLGGPLTREQLMAGASAVWLGSIYGRTSP